MIQNSPTEISSQTEIRKLGAYFANGLHQLLDAGNDWERVMCEIRQDYFNLNDENRRYTAEDIREIKSTREPGESCTEIFLDEWGTSGKERPTLQLLYNYLKTAGLLRAANYLATQFPSVNLTVQTIEPSEVSSPELVPFNALEEATKGFNREQLLGEGEFASFHFVKWNGLDCVIKRLKYEGKAQFEREWFMLSSGINHPRLLRPIAASNDTVPCLIHLHMPHGSLKDRLAGTVREKNLAPLGWRTRLIISNHIIEALCYLHSLPQPIVHRRLKSSNILLDAVDIPHISDFGFIHCEGFASFKVEDKNGYMAPEAFLSPCINNKLDIYSYGVVLLDLLTGSLTLDKEDSNWVEYVKKTIRTRNNNIVTSLLDRKWRSKIANQLYTIAIDCLESESEKRPDSNEVKYLVENLLKHDEITREVLTE